MKISKDTIGNQTRDLAAFSAVPQPTAPPRAYRKGKINKRRNDSLKNETAAYRLDVKMQNVCHVRGQLVHHCEVAELTGPVCDDDGPHARSRQDADPRHAMRLPSDTERWYISYTTFLTSSTLFPASSVIVIALTYLGPTPPLHTHPLARSQLSVTSLHVTLTSPRGLPLYLEVGGSTLLLKVINVYQTARGRALFSSYCV